MHAPSITNRSEYMSVYKQLNAMSDDDSVNDLIKTMKKKEKKYLKNDELCDKNKVVNIDSLYQIEP